MEYGYTAYMERFAHPKEGSLGDLSLPISRCFTSILLLLLLFFFFNFSLAEMSPFLEPVKTRHQ